MRTTRVHAFRDDALGHDDATELARRVAAREVSSAELVDAAIARLEDVEPELAAVAFRDTDRARRRAGAQRRPWGRFGGVPTALKDNITVAGMPFTFGSEALAPTPLPTDGPFTRQLLATGLVPICSTTTPAFGWTASTELTGGRATHNPWHPGHSAGGSSGGSAALTAAGVVPMAHGNDGGGSIRIPAAACGLVGLKPTRGRTRRDPTARMPIDLISNGVLSRTVRDTAGFFAALEETYRNRRLPPVGEVTGPPRKRLVIGLAMDSPWAPVTDVETRRVVTEAAQLLESLGHKVVDYHPRAPRVFNDDFLDYWSLLAFSVMHDGRRIFGSGFDRSRLDPMTVGLAQRFVRRSRHLPVSLPRLAATRHLYGLTFGEVDALLTPVLCHTTPLIGHLGADQPFEEHFPKLLDYVGFTPLHNACGAPSVSLPLGSTEVAGGALPVGVLLSARYGHDRLLLELALEIEAARPFARIDQARPEEGAEIGPEDGAGEGLGVGRGEAPTGGADRVSRPVGPAG